MNCDNDDRATTTGGVHLFPASTGSKKTARAGPVVETRAGGAYPALAVFLSSPDANDLGVTFTIQPTEASFAYFEIRAIRCHSFPSGRLSALSLSQLATTTGLPHLVPPNSTAHPTSTIQSLVLSKYHERATYEGVEGQVVAMDGLGEVLAPHIALLSVGKALRLHLDYRYRTCLSINCHVRSTTRTAAQSSTKSTTRRLVQSIPPNCISRVQAFPLVNRVLSEFRVFDHVACTIGLILGVLNTTCTSTPFV
ncbi:hypothetical protein CC1G_12810 [Coprinopsis cinerea okayama7|uniref:Uncharacterized protein n=1 Tax=Coprinopsis cinerea (strain Okayama-7 / 130 / ATCC MYA-4618 / FGSC 9003) TaxID=240176 RepID=A8P911_COPC7|nr:hypothetical protein CC1G_12810 [Coprinopsis cinerea okayama7\|eukprot:XP_001839675.2 hypothetical protein CC1G_12810 [Coprinopsis cinerea okayama7\